ncbi:MAG: bifunctional glycosyltransferase family 2/GtrA family protein [Eubacteriales bacterium]|nr:bifunctional glycosyltransferase family 2/GtrA family protein [Eubacteriales bacterium]
MNIAILIPSLDPDDALVTLVSSLQQRGVDHIVVIDDGSAAQEQFDRCAALGCVVAHHTRNLGKGAAIRTGLRTAQQHFPDLAGVVTADGDGQHAVEDILRVAQEVLRCPDSVTLGTRDFSAPGIPARSRFGNRFSSLFFRLSAGVPCPDTQTGLRGIPASLFDFALSIPGSRYEYEMNFLFTVAQQSIPLHFIPIQTIYEAGNQSSHFRPIRDSARIYAMPLRFAAASLSSFVIDIALFALFSQLFAVRTARAIFIATAAARVCSGVVNFTLNRSWSFANKEDDWKAQGIRYLILFLCQMCASSGLVYLLAFLPLPLTFIKIVVDTGLFCVSYFIQRNWVFRKKR